MDPRLKASVLWGVIGGLLFLVLVQGYTLFGDLALGFGTKLAVAAAVGAVTTGLSYATTD